MNKIRSNSLQQLKSSDKKWLLRLELSELLLQLMLLIELKPVSMLLRLLSQNPSSCLKLLLIKLMRKKQSLLQESRLSERTLNGRSSNTRKLENFKFSTSPKKKKSMMATGMIMDTTIISIMKKSKNLLLSSRKQLKMNARHLIDSSLLDVKNLKSRSALKRLHLPK